MCSYLYKLSFAHSRVDLVLSDDLVQRGVHGVLLHRGIDGDLDMWRLPGGLDMWHGASTARLGVLASPSLSPSPCLPLPVPLPLMLDARCDAGCDTIIPRAATRDATHASWHATPSGQAPGWTPRDRRLRAGGVMARLTGPQTPCGVWQQGLLAPSCQSPVSHECRMEMVPEPASNRHISGEVI
jgi:hypothetical protein